MKRYVKWGAVAGLAGGLASALFLVVVGEHSIRAALTLESMRAAAANSHPAMFSRPVQLVGGAVAAALYGAAVGVVFAVVFAAIRHRSRLRDDFVRSLGLGAVAFVTLAVAPQLKYPANPPAVGDPNTVNERTVAYLTFVAAVIVLAYGAWRASRWLRTRGVDDAARVPAIGFGVAGVVGVLMLAWPASPDPVTVPANLIWHFRLASLAGMALLWSVTATVFGWLASAEARRTAREAVHDAAWDGPAVRA